MKESPELTEVVYPEVVGADFSSYEENSDIEAAAKEAGELLAEFGIPAWRKTKVIEGVYRSRFGYDLDTCPECKEKTKRYASELSCSTDHGVLSTVYPDTFICEECSVMVIDEEPVSDDIDEKCGYRYLFPLGIRDLDLDPEPSRDQDPSYFFKYYEGRVCLALPDRDQNLRLIPGTKIRHAFGQYASEIKKNEHKKRKRKLQKQARKNSRKK